MIDDLNPTPTVLPTPFEFWGHCATSWVHVASGAREAGNLAQEMFFEELADSALYMTTLLACRT